MGKHDWNWKPPAPAPKVSAVRAAVYEADFVAHERQTIGEIREAMAHRYPRQCPMCQEFVTEPVPGQSELCRCRRASCRAVWRVWRDVQNHP